MKELSLHILDIVQNSITANAKLITITIAEDVPADTLTITIGDNGKGMSEELLARVRDPFVTSRTTRPVGMGISLFESAAAATGGGLDIQSKLGEGTTVTATFGHSHIDRQPIGDMASTFAMLVSGNPSVDFVYRHSVNGEAFTVDTREIKKILGEVPVDSIEVVNWIKEYVEESLNTISGGIKE